ncbi:MAG TPA: site-2 protease family protein [Dehalococcoidia bacterium]|nr:site-2 protease family protein [Dehalococcoidia bacterium]
MSNNIRLGRILGIDIEIHWTWLLIFVLVSWTFAVGVLKQFYPDWTTAQRWVAGGAISIVFFVSILLHELSHSLVARRYSLPVTSITLFVFGGVSNLSKEPENATQEFRIAIVGPLMSFALAILFAIGYVAFTPIEDGIGGVCENLAFINLALGVFNLVPGFPLDGGRVLRSFLWRRTGDRLEATRLASKVGEWVAYGLMGLGVVTFFLVDLVTGIWFYLIGNFLNSAARSSYSQLLVETTLKGVPVTTVARTNFVGLSPDTSLATLAEDYILAGKGRVFPVLAGEELLGLITISDLRHVPREDWPATTVYRAMTPLTKLRSVGKRDDLADALSKLATDDIHQVPLLDGKLLVGMVDRSDLLRYMQTQSELHAHARPT